MQSDGFISVVLFVAALVVLAPAVVTVSILLVRRPDDPQRPPNVSGFPVIPLDPRSPTDRTPP